MSFPASPAPISLPHSPRGPLLLASVRSVAEALAAVAGGAAIIDAKEPERGALGDVAPLEVTAIRAALASGILVSATIGDVAAAELDEIEARIAAMSAAGADIVKIGLFSPGDPHALLDRLAGNRTAFGRRFLVVLADRGVDLTLLRSLPAAGFAGVMLDTADKAAGSLPDVLDRDALAEFVFTARQAGLRVGLAGALRLWHIPRMLALGADILGFRGALCAGSERAGDVDTRLVTEVACAMRLPAEALPAL